MLLKPRTMDSQVSQQLHIDWSPGLLALHLVGHERGFWMAVVQPRRIGLFLIFVAFLFSLNSLGQVSFTNNYVSFVDKQYISVNRNQFSNNFVIQDKRKIRMDGFSVWEKIEEKGDKRGFEGRVGVTTKPPVATKESAADVGISASPTSRLSRVDNVSASR